MSYRPRSRAVQYFKRPSAASIGCINADLCLYADIPISYRLPLFEGCTPIRRPLVSINAPPRWSAARFDCAHCNNVHEANLSNRVRQALCFIQLRASQHESSQHQPRQRADRTAMTERACDGERHIRLGADPRSLFFPSIISANHSSRFIS
jgi:hypothetical protein